MKAIVQMVIAGFKRAPIGTWGKETAVTIDFHFGEIIESLGIGDVLGKPEEVRNFIAGHPELNQLATSDARWKQFEAEFLEYTVERWGASDDDEQNETAGTGPEPPAA
jgi:hypothetical protein